MAITRKYETKEDCVKLFVDERFDNFPSWVVTDQFARAWDCPSAYGDDFYEDWAFEGICDCEDAETCGDDSIDGVYGMTHVPMWGTWFIPNDSWIEGFIDENRETVADCGFTLIFHDGDLFALGIDGAGYSFMEHHWSKLYDAMGLKWHE